MTASTLRAAVLPLLLVAGCAASNGRGGAENPTTAAEEAAPPAAPASRVVTTSSGLQYEDLVVGDGRMAEAGMQAVVHYTGTFPDGRQFDSSHDRGQPYPFRLGAGVVIRGWDEGIAGMRVGGKRRLVIPPALAYGPDGRGRIPPNATLHFDVELVDLR